MFAGSEDGGEAMSSAFTLIETAKLDSVAAKVLLTCILNIIADHKKIRTDELMP